jgi:hypothetical protein
MDPSIGVFNSHKVIDSEPEPEAGNKVPDKKK